MSELVWFDLYPPRSLDLAAVVGLMRPLASRPQAGFWQRTPTVVLEAWIGLDSTEWLLGMDPQLTATVPGQFRAHLPQLGLLPSRYPNRPMPLLAADVRLSSFAFPLRLDVAEAVGAGMRAVASMLEDTEAAVLQWVLGPSYQRASRPEVFNIVEALGFDKPKAASASDNQAWRNKTAEPLYGVQGRVGATAASKARMLTIMRSVVSALALANSPHCSVRMDEPKPKRPYDIIRVHRPAVTWSSVVSSSELAVLLGWPLGSVADGASLLGQPPADLLVQPEEAHRYRGTRLLGTSTHPADRGQLVTMPQASSTHNFHLIGPTGSGKSTELAQLILADAAAGRGILAIEPRGDLVDDVLARLPRHRHADVVVIDPSEDDQAGFNPLAGPEKQAEQRADEIVGLLRNLFGNSAIGPRSSDVLFHSLLTAARMPDGTLADVPILMLNPAFRRRALTTVGDPLVLTRWWARFGGLSDGEQQQIIAPVLNKISPFLARQPIRRMLGQAAPRFSFDKLFLRRPRIVLVSLNRGVIGPEASRLLGALILSAAWAAAQRRATLPKSKRFPVSMVVDEFQDYVGALDFGEVLAQCRGLEVSTTAAHQHFTQLSHNLQAAVTSNARSRLSFRPSFDDARLLAAIFGDPVTPEDLLGLGAFEACARLYVKGTMTPPFAVRTLPLAAPDHDPAVLRQMSRDAYATSGSALDSVLAQRWHGEGGPPDAPVGTRRRSS
ncbi:type IV secretory system conjugative DNA transfer family protein [Lentzea sp. NPDC005914]|uniref:type IV secretory system conjugative DNA transfer family protein n=1 Tax=Lentzea sp. NPDC005914 TaxID=3154572 RepID=UPI0033FE863A